MWSPENGSGNRNEIGMKTSSPGRKDDYQRVQLIASNHFPESASCLVNFSHHRNGRHSPTSPLFSSSKENGQVSGPPSAEQNIHIRENPLDREAEVRRTGSPDGPPPTASNVSVAGPKPSAKRANLKYQILRRPGILQRKTTPLERYLLLTVILLFAACLGFIYNAYLQARSPEYRVCLTEECVKTASSLMEAMDRTADPCDDFFLFACGLWNKRHVIPEDRSSISTFEVLADQLQVILKGLLEESMSEDDSDASLKAKQFYKSCMNSSQIQDMGSNPVQSVLQEFGGWPVTEPNWVPPPVSVEVLLGQLRGDYNQGIIIEQWVGPDDKNSSVNIIQLDQMSLGLPSREYYLKNSSVKEFQAYHQLMVDVAVLLGATDKTAYTDMMDAIQFEKELANASTPEADRHDTGAIYSKLSLSELQEEVPDINWLEYLNAFLPTKIDEEEPVVVYALPYLKQMSKIMNKTDRRVIHNYALWRLINEFLPHLGDEFQQRRADFRRVLWGISAERVRWTQCVDLVNKKLGMAVGALFIKENFNHESKETALEMITNIRMAFNELLEENDWMDVETREVARDKANAMNERIGYPELLMDKDALNKEYEHLQISEDHFFQNIINALKFEATKNLVNLRQPVNKDKWTTEPAVVNAFYNPNKNDIVFPAGILQPLFYSQHSPKSLNYGGIGVVIGHEITHGFDDKGRQFDKDGNLKQWWNNATIRTFRDRAQCIVDQYSSYILEEVGLPVNGKMTQGENIADNGGLKQAFRAYKKWVEVNGEEPALPGINLTHDQLFFLNYAQIWCGSMRPEDALSKIRSSVHSPGPIRVLGPLSNSYDFAKAYNCHEGRMNPKKKCTVW